MLLRLHSEKIRSKVEFTFYVFIITFIMQFEIAALRNLPLESGVRYYGIQYLTIFGAVMR